MRFLIALLIILTVHIEAHAAAKALRLPKRPASIMQVLPNEFMFGTSWFSKIREWSVERYQEDGIRWGFTYTYVFPRTSKEVGTEQIYIDWVCDKARRTRSMPIFSMYGLLRLARAKNFNGSEIDAVNRVCQDTASMKQYFLEHIRIMKMIQSKNMYAIFHSEPDSWAFLEWHGTNDTHDPHQVSVQVSATGLPELQEFADTAAGMGQALIHLRDLYAPNLFMGFHCKDCRAGTNPEYTVKFMKSLGKWDVLLGDGIGHLYDSREGAWWDTFSEERFNRYKHWFSTVSKEMALPYIHWQSSVGKADFTLLEQYPDKQRISEYIKMGSIGVCFDIRAPDHNAFPSDKNHGYSNRPPAGHIADNTLGSLIKRLKTYYQNPMSLDGRFKSEQVKDETRKKERLQKEQQRQKQQALRKQERESKLAQLRAAKDEYSKRLQVECERQIADKRRIYFHYSMMKGEVSIEGLSSKGYELKNAGGMRMSIDIWKRLADKDAASLAAALRRYGGEEANALAAYFHLLINDKGKAMGYLQKAGAKGTAVRALMK